MKRTETTRGTRTRGRKTRGGKRALKWALVVVGLALLGHFGLQAVESSRQLAYLHERGFDTGDADADAIRPWMTIHFVASAYAVPEEYLYAKLGVAPGERDGHVSVRQLNRQLGLGPAADGRGPAIVERLGELVLAYRADPVATGLTELRGWMTIGYIANASGTPAADLVAGLAPETAERAGARLHLPLDALAAELAYPGGPRALERDLEAVLRPPAGGAG